MAVSAPPRASVWIASTPSRSMTMLAMLRVKRTRPLLAATLNELADVGAVERERVGVALALDGVVAVARVPVEAVVAASRAAPCRCRGCRRRCRCRCRRSASRGRRRRAIVSSPAPPSIVTVLSLTAAAKSVTSSSPSPAVICTAVKVAFSKRKSIVPSAPTSIASAVPSGIEDQPVARAVAGYSQRAALDVRLIARQRPGREAEQCQECRPGNHGLFHGVTNVGPRRPIPARGSSSRLARVRGRPRRPSPRAPSGSSGRAR